MGKNLIVYFSRNGENYVNGAIKELPRGNTEIVAEMIQKAVGGEIVKVEPVNPYPQNYRACVLRAKSEAENNERVPVKNPSVDLSDIDVVFVGYPNWWGTMPMCMFTMLEKLDLHGKKVAPFCTAEGSGMGQSESDLAAVCEGADIFKGLAVMGATVEKSFSDVAAWAYRAVKPEVETEE